MKRFHTSKAALAFSLGAMSVLAITVFLWGVEYKCSLYHRHPEKHPRMVAAKLLSETERPRAHSATSWLRVVLLPFAAPALLLFLIARDRRRGGLRFTPTILRTKCCSPQLSRLVHFFFRPPPILAP